MSRYFLLTAMLMSVTGLSVPAAGPDEAAGFQVVVNASNSVAQLSSDEVARLFLKKVRKWPDGRMVAPVDQSSTSPVRASFAKGVLQLSLGEQKDYWLRQTLSGREVPPRALADDDAVLEFVAAQPGAIAYVSDGARLPSSVHSLKLVGE